MEGKLIKVEDDYRLINTNNSIIGTTDLEYQQAFSDVCQKLSLKNCEAVVNGYDLDELACDEIGIDISVIKHIDSKLESHSSPCIPLNEGGCVGAGLYHMVKGFEIGFQKALELLGDKKFSEFLDKEKELGISDIKTIERIQWYYKTYFDKSQQTEWNVEIVYDRDCYSSDGRCDKSTMANCIICTPVTYLKDADGCLILKRK